MLDHRGRNGVRWDDRWIVLDLRGWNWWVIGQREGGAEEEEDGLDGRMEVMREP